MSLTAIENQPIQFDVNPAACNAPTYDYIQIVDNNDVSQIQFKISPCLTANNLVIDGGFTSTDDWTVTDSFSVDPSTNQACKASGGIGTITQYNVFETGKYYQLRIVIASINETMQVWNGIQQLGNVSGVGEYVFSFIANGDSVSIRSFSATNEACVSSISAYELDDRLLIAVFDLNGTYQNGITLADNPEYFTLAKDTITVELNWSDLSVSNGCYYIGIADPCANTNGQNGIADTSLIQSNNWTVTKGANAGDSDFNTELGPGFTYESDGTGAPGEVDLLNDFITLGDGLSYDVTIRFQEGNVNHRIQVQLGTAGNTFTPTGAFNDEQTATIVCSGGTGFNINCATLSAVANLTTLIDYIEIKLTNLSDISPDSQSVNLKLGTFDCSVLVNMNCNDDAVGFEFEQSGFNPRVRLEGELINPTYPTIRTVIKDTRGNYNTVYGERVKAYLMRLDLQPEYMLDFLSLLPMVDNMWVDGTKFHVQDEQSEIDYPDVLVSTGKLDYVLIEQGSQLTNRNTTGTTNDTHVMGTDYIVNPLIDDEIITEPDTGDRLKAI